jgi:hypothetical protein
VTHGPTAVPPQVRVAMAHAAVQYLATRANTDLLHIKGPALDRDLTWDGRSGTDADILVRPAHLPRLLELLAACSWVQMDSFQTSSSFEHSATFRHENWGYVDVHRYIPGIALDPSKAFDVLWEERKTRMIAGHGCAVPSGPAQILILVLHAARSGGSKRGQDDVKASWGAASSAARLQVLDLVSRLDAHVGFSVIEGNLERYRSAPDYPLWKVASEGGTRFDEWRARVKAAPSRRAALRVALRAPLVNVDHLAILLGRKPTRLEVAKEFFRRFTRGFRQQWQQLLRRGRGR